MTRYSLRNAPFDGGIFDERIFDTDLNRPYLQARRRRHSGPDYEVYRLPKED